MQRALNSPPRFERRAKARVSVPFQAMVHGTDVEGSHFEVTTVLDNLGPGGLYVRLTREVQVGAKLLVTIHIDCHEGGPAEHSLCLEVYGPVRRVDTQPGGTYGLAVSFTNSVLL